MLLILELQNGASSVETQICDIEKPLQDQGAKINQINTTLKGSQNISADKGDAKVDKEARETDLKSKMQNNQLEDRDQRINRPEYVPDRYFKCNKIVSLVGLLLICSLIIIGAVSSLTYLREQESKFRNEQIKTQKNAYDLKVCNKRLMDLSEEALVQKGQ